MPWANNDKREIFPEGSWHVRDGTLQKQDIVDLGHPVAAKSHSYVLPSLPQLRRITETEIR